jgi:hypothetical protein
MLPSLSPASTIAPAPFIDSLAVSDAAREHAGAARNLHDLLRLLAEKRLQVDAVRILLRALPKRYAVAWACECFKADSEREPLPPAEQQCLQSAEAWVAEGDERARQAAFALAEAGNFDTAGAWLAAAAAFSSGSLTPPGYAAVEPADHLTADACFAALCLLAARDPGAFGRRLSVWIDRALAVFARSEAAPSDGQGSVRP